MTNFGDKLVNYSDVSTPREVSSGRIKSWRKGESGEEKENSESSGQENSESSGQEWGLDKGALKRC